jgi:hypothetical protein
MTVSRLDVSGNREQFFKKLLLQSAFSDGTIKGQVFTLDICLSKTKIEIEIEKAAVRKSVIPRQHEEFCLMRKQTFQVLKI